MPRRQSTAESQDPLTSLSHDLLAHIVGYLPERQFDAAARTHTTLRTAVQARPITQGCNRRIRKLAKFESHMGTIFGLQTNGTSKRRGLNLSACLSLKEPVRTQQLQLLQKWISDGRIIQLDLSNNGLTSQEVNYLALQSDSTSLTSINVGANRLVEEAALGIVRAVKPRNQMISLGLSECNIGPRGAEEIAQYVSDSRVLTNLDLSSNQLCGIDVYGRGTYDPTGIQALASALGTSVLTVLDLGHNDIRVEGAKALADALKSGTSVLTNLDLSTNNLAAETGYIEATEVEGDSKEVGAQVMYQGREMTVIKGIDSDGELKLADFSGVYALANALKFNAVLNKLVLYSNPIRDEGAIALGEALKSNKTLKELDLFNCSIGAKGGKALAAALGTAALTKLNARHNYFRLENDKLLQDAAEGREGFELLL